MVSLAQGHARSGNVDQMGLVGLHTMLVDVLTTWVGSKEVVLEVGRSAHRAKRWAERVYS
jgi:hypothetical protein